MSLQEHHSGCWWIMDCAVTLRGTAVEIWLLYGPQEVLMASCLGLPTCSGLDLAVASGSLTLVDVGPIPTSAHARLPKSLPHCPAGSKVEPGVD
jgi:hypothetical protein